MVTTIKLINKSITSHYYFCFVVVKIRCTPSANFKHTTILTIVTILYIGTPQNLSILHNRNCVPFDQHLDMSYTLQPLTATNLLFLGSTL